MTTHDGRRSTLLTAALATAVTVALTTTVGIGLVTAPAHAQDAPTVVMTNDKGVYRFTPPTVTASADGKVVICNRMTVFAGLFGATKGNQFGKPKGLRLKPGECMTISLKNSSNAPIAANISDEIHSRIKPLRVSVPPISATATTTTTAPAAGAVGPTGWYWMDYKVNDTPIRRAVGLKFQSSGELQLVGPEASGTLQMRLTNGVCTYVESSARGTCELTPQGGFAKDSTSGAVVTFTLARMSPADAKSTKAGLGNRDDFDAPDQTGGLPA